MRSPQNPDPKECQLSPPPPRAAIVPTEACQKCGGVNVCWFAPSEIWNKVVREKGLPDFLCIPCFIIAAEEAGFNTEAWKLEPESWACSSTGSEQGDSNATVAGSNPATPTTSRRAAAPVETPAARLGDDTVSASALAAAHKWRAARSKYYEDYDPKNVDEMLADYRASGEPE